MYEVIFVTVLATISILLALSYILPSTDTPKRRTSDDFEKPIVEDEKTNGYPDSCYDAITVREKGRVYIFQSKKPLQEGVNPKIFPDLPSYRVWAERSLEDGIKCPVLFYNADDPPYEHPEESMIDSSEHALVRSAKKNRQALYDDPALPSEPARHIPDDLHDNLVRRSQREAVGARADDPALVPERNPLRDVSRKEINHLSRELQRENPELKGMILKRTGYSKYEVDEFIPESAPFDADEYEPVQTKGLDLDLLAYGGTVVPVKNVNTLFA